MSTTKPRILVVDDESAVVLLCRYVLEDAGYEVEVATSALEASAKIASEPFSAYLVDLVMPRDGGLEVIRAARTFSPKTPVVVMTAEPEHLVPPRAGMDYYLHKPFHGLQALEEVVARAISRGPRSAQAELSASA